MYQFDIPDSLLIQDSYCASAKRSALYRVWGCAAEWDAVTAPAFLGKTKIKDIASYMSAF